MAEDQDRFEKLVQQIGSTLAALGSAVAVFYALGFLVVQCFINSADVAGMFWFSREYYEEAGGKFLVEIVRTPLMKPAFFVLYLAFLVYLIPGQEAFSKVSSEGGFGKKITEIYRQNRIKAGFFLSITTVTYFFVAYFDRWAGSRFFVDYVMPVFFWSQDTPSEQKSALLFFSLTVPVVFALAVFIRRLFKNSASKGRLGAAVFLYILFVSILPISYGRYLYDIKAVPINNPKRMYELSNIKSDLSNASKMWFLGRFGGKYLFLRKDNLITDPKADIHTIALGRTEGVVESLNEADVKNMNFTLERADSLRSLMKASKTGVFVREAEKVFDDIFNGKGDQ